MRILTSVFALLVLLVVGAPASAQTVTCNVLSASASSGWMLIDCPNGVIGWRAGMKVTIPTGPTTPPPTPVNCVGAWGNRTFVSATACVANSRTATYGEVFTITTPASNGGNACVPPNNGATRQVQVVESCSVQPPQPPPVSPSTAALQAQLLNFAQVWKRNWSHGGHNVVVGAGSPPFDENYGYWAYTETTYEPWLFDRATAGMRLYQLTGDAQWRTQFRTDLAWYSQRIDTAGIFTPKGAGDTKYSYITPLVLGVADGAISQVAALPIADRIYNAWASDWPNVANLSGLWTERENGLALEAAVAYYELTGQAAALTRGQALLNQWDQVVQQTGNLGAPRVSYTLHEGGGPGGTTPTDPTNSPWMSALYFQAARRFAILQPSAAAQVNQQVSKYFDYLDTPEGAQSRGFYDAALAHPENAGYVFPRYLTETLIGDAGYDAGNQAHALDVAGVVAHALVAKQALGQSTTRAAFRLAQMKAAAGRTFSTEPGAYERTANWLPRYRVNPPRMGNWWIRGLYELIALGQ